MTRCPVLEGIRVIDCTHILSGPLCGRFLAELGAEVIKVEPLTGDEYRHMGPNRWYGSWVPNTWDKRLGTPITHDWMQFNLNKKSVTLNLRTEKGKEMFWELLKKSDVFLNNYRPGAYDKLGFGYEEVTKVIPTMIYATTSGYGYTGPLRDNKAGWDVYCQAWNGFMANNGVEGGPPTPAPTWHYDYMTPSIGAICILAALMHRQKTGKGQRVDVSLYETGLLTMSIHMGVALTQGWTPTRGHSGGQGGPIRGFGTFVMKAKDGWIYVSARSNDAWNALLKLMGREDMIGNPQFNTNAKRRLRKEFLEGMIADWMKTKNRDELIELFKTTWSGPARANILAAPIREVDELPNDPHGRARGTIIDVEHPTAGKVTIVGSILKMSETPGTVEWLGMSLGYHNEEVYGKLLGYSKEQIAKLEKEGVI